MKKNSAVTEYTLRHESGDKASPGWFEIDILPPSIRLERDPGRHDGQWSVSLDVDSDSIPIADARPIAEALTDAVRLAEQLNEVSPG